MQQLECSGGFATQNSADEIGYDVFAGETENVEHILFHYFVATECDQLVEHRFRIPHSPFGAARDRMRGRRCQRDFLFFSNELQMLRDQIAGNAMEIEALATTENGR